MDRSAARSILTALGGGFGHVHLSGDCRFVLASIFRRLRRQCLVQPMIFCPARLRHFIEQDCDSCADFFPCAKRAAGGTDAGKLAR
jgi:hypothetical protein